MNQAPLVSVICLCYNHARFVQEAIHSVLTQSYEQIELIVVDDASQDQSAAVIKSIISTYTGYKKIKVLLLPENQGNCRAFNQGLALAEGKYVIDFATDDVMLPEKIIRQLAFFEQLPEEYGVVFTEAQYIDEHGAYLYRHYQEKLHCQPAAIPTGDVYADVLRKYFICGPSMMVKKKVFDSLGGYDEQLAYEDFDFWIRSSRLFKYAYMDMCTVQVRKLAGSLSTKAGKKGDKQLNTTYLVCRKALKLNKTAHENSALVARIRYELSYCLRTANVKEAWLFFHLLRTLLGGSAFQGVHHALGFRRLLKKLWEHWQRKMPVTIRQ